MEQLEGPHNNRIYNHQTSKSSLPDHIPKHRSVHLKSNEPPRIVDLPVFQTVNIETHVIDKPEIHFIEHYKEKIEIQEIVKHVPKITYVDREKVIEIPEYRVIERHIEVPQVITKFVEVPKYEIREVVVEVPKLVTKYIEKRIEVPQIEFVDRIVEVPQIEEVIRHVPKIKIVEVPVEKLVIIPKIEIQKIEKIQEIPGPIQYKEIPFEKCVLCPKPRLIETIKKTFARKDVFIDTNIKIPVPGETVEVPFDVKEIVHKIVPNYIPGKTIDKYIPVPIEKVIEIPIPEAREQIRVVREERFIPKEIIKEVEGLETVVEEIVDVPCYVYIEEPKTIVRPRFIRKYKEIPSVSRTTIPTSNIVDRNENTTDSTKTPLAFSSPPPSSNHCIDAHK